MKMRGSLSEISQFQAKIPGLRKKADPRNCEYLQQFLSYNSDFYSVSYQIMEKRMVKFSVKTAYLTANGRTSKKMSEKWTTFDALEVSV